MEDSKLFVKIGHSCQNLFHDDPNLVLFIQFLSRFDLSLYKLCKTHIHLFKHDKKFTVFIFYAFSFHYEWAVLSWTHLIDFTKSLQYLNFSLVKSLFLISKFIFKVFYSANLPRLYMFTFIYISETATTNQFFTFIFIINNQFRFLRRNSSI